MLGEKRDDRVVEIHRLFAGDRVHLKRDGGRLACWVARGNHAGAVGQRLHQAVGDSHQAGRLGSQGNFSGLVGHGTVAKRLHDQQLLSGISAFECNTVHARASPIRSRYCEFDLC